MRKEKKYLSIKDIEKVGKTFVGKSFKELGDYEKLLHNKSKGSLGQLVEEIGFGYRVNSNPNPDFEEVGIELKVTPVKRNKNGTLSAKERLVLNIINYMEEYKKTFYDSSFWLKNNKLYLLFYLWEESKKKEDYKIIHEMFYEYPEEDLIIIKNDWKTIIGKIKNGLAHEISEADTMYLAACPKGANKKSVRKQPFSNILAMQRAYSLKTSYMTQVIRKHISNEKTENIIKLEEIREKSFEEVIIEKLKNYKGLSRSELMKIFSINLKTSTKNINEIILAKMLGIEGRVSKTTEFLKAKIVPKTIRIEENGKIKESMSFPAFKFKEIINEEWEESTLREMFESTKFMFVIFRKKGTQYYFDNVFFWNMPLSILDKFVKDVWKKTIEVIKSGNIVKTILPSGMKLSNFPKMKENPVCHVRPHARIAKDVYELPVADRKTGIKFYSKHCFWLNSSYIKKIIEDYLNKSNID